MWVSDDWVLRRLEGDVDVEVKEGEGKAESGNNGDEGKEGEEVEGGNNGGEGGGAA